jgi:hypothetical protein
MVVLCVFHAADFNKSEQSTLSLSDFSVRTSVFSSVCSSMFWESWESAACLARLLRSVYGLSWAASPTCLWGGVQTSACLWVVLCVMRQPSVLDTFARPQPVHADPLSRQVAARGAAAADAE